ncbi:hypothetical protein BCR39DRAFT_561576 [Naematelia encephala]|uniref:Transglutaminase-like domain-containing protein n=1 Tax=Naematelia encephala TaxID=71784 RepID=A0A1Y2AQ20_9TREE|nr:hypothetical protein BCR39DRAFT_561576 [Naematelia encephala]
MSSYVAGQNAAVVAGYIARQLLKGVYTSIPNPPDTSEYFRQVRTLQALLNVIGPQSLSNVVYASLQRSQRRPMHQFGDMKEVLRGLKRHTLPISQELDGLRTSELYSIIPMSSITTEANSLLAPPPFLPFGETDAQVLALARWFKSQYMRWVDPIPCSVCGGKTRSAGGTEPTPEERSEGAGRVEIHECAEETNCSARTRFPRYRSVRSLIRTRTGRCGEWAQLFYDFLRVAGIESRYVWNSEDHVWTEYWSPEAQHWVHVDSCEAAVSKPLLYARGWGKKQAFCIAVGPYGYEDVTCAYVDDFDGACQGRRRARGWSEKLLRQALLEGTIELRINLPEEERVRLESMDDMQELWISDKNRRDEEAEQAELGGRTSGPEDWRKMRSELGQMERKIPTYQTLSDLVVATDLTKLLGDARVESATLLLTDTAGLTSAVFADKMIRQNDSFKCSLTFRMTEVSGSGAADGMAVAFCQEAGLGLGGYGMGYSGLGGEGDFAVEIDTYRTQDFADDPPTPHISVQSPPNAHHRHSIACTPDHSLPYLSNGQLHTLELIYNGNERLLHATLMLPRSDDEQSEREVLALFDVKIPSGKGDFWKVGVTAASGGLWQRQEVVDFRLTEIAFTP